MLKHLLTTTLIALISLSAVGPTRNSANPVPMPPIRGDDNPVRRLASELTLSEPQHYRNLTIIPILANRQQYQGQSFLTLDRALDQGVVRVEEKGAGEVNTVRVRNTGKLTVFGLAGEMIVGARQDRMLKSDVLIPPHSDWIDIGVYCTEHGRWDGATREFRSMRTVAPGGLRGKAAQTESQREVWADVARTQGAVSASAGTSALKSVYSAPKVSGQSEAYLDHFRPIPRDADRAVGVLVAVGNRIVCMDIFGSHELFQDMWDKLLRSYVVDALSEPELGRLERREAEQFMRTLDDADLQRRSTPGSGQLYRIRATEGEGSGLVFHEQVVHLDLFPSAAGSDEPGQDQGPSLDFRRPSR